MKRILDAVVGELFTTRVEKIHVDSGDDGSTLAIITAISTDVNPQKQIWINRRLRMSSIMHRKNDRRTLRMTGPHHTITAIKCSEPVRLICSAFSGGGFGRVAEATWAAHVPERMKGILSKDIEQKPNSAVKAEAERERAEAEREQVAANNGATRFEGIQRTTIFSAIWRL